MKSNTQKEKNKQNSKKQQNRNDTKEQIKDGINLDYDYNTEYGDGDIPEIDK